jgi:hypothetical protein
MSSVSPVGTIAYIIDEEALLVRVNNGWQYIAVSCAVLFPCSLYLSYEKCIVIMQYRFQRRRNLGRPGGSIMRLALRLETLTRSLTTESIQRKSCIVQ